MRFQAAILESVRRPLVVEEVELDGIGEHQVLVRVIASGVCHTDFEVYVGAVPLPLPLVLGHEVAGDVVEVGASVQDVVVGDRVIASWNPTCGRCFYCVSAQPRLCEWAAAAASSGRLPGDSSPRLRRGSEAVHQFSMIAGHAEFAVIHERSAIRVGTRIPAALACTIGCTVATGVCGAIRAAKVSPGSTVAVVGCGAIGLAAIQGARIAGAQRVFAVDRLAARLEVARQLGASDIIDVSATDAPATVREATHGRGADHVVEAAGSPAGFQTAIDCCRPGGRIALLGKVGSNDTLGLRFGSLLGEKEIIRSSYGGAVPPVDFPYIVELWERGELQIEPLVTSRLHLDGINAGLAEIATSNTLHAVIEPILNV